MTTYSTVRLYTKCSWQIGTDSNNQPVYRDYEEGELHQPIWKSNSVIIPIPGGASKTYSNVTPRKGRELSEMELPLELSDYGGRLFMNNADGLRFIIITTSASKNIFGWIDDIIPIATKGPSSNALIRWHIDAWMTWAYNYRMSSAFGGSFGHGRIKRGPSDLKRPEPSEPRKWVFDSSTELKIANDTYGPYCVVMFTKTVTSAGGDEYTTFYLAYWGVRQVNIHEGSNTYSVIPIQSVYEGVLEELLGISPNSIVGIWFSPIPPGDINTATIKHNQTSAGTWGWYESANGYQTYSVELNLSNDTLKTDDDNKYLIVDPSGGVQNTLPWDLGFKTVTMSLDIGTSGAYLVLRFNAAAGDPVVKGEGRIVQIPLISAPITSNDRSEYVLSGQRDYDRETALLQQQQNLQSGVAGAGQSALGGLVGGALAGGLAGAIAGALGGAAIGIGGAYLNYDIARYYDSKSQAAYDKLISNQTASVLIQGGSVTWYSILGGKWELIKLTRDAVSAAELTAEQSELGYITDTYAADCSTIISQGGGLRIEGLEMHGNYLPQLKAKISEMFAHGVHLDLIQ